MRSCPNALELLKIAEQTLITEVASDMSRRQRYTAALVASAIGIARRELARGICAWADELYTLRALYHADPTEEPESSLRELHRRLASDLRAGVYDENAKKRTAALGLLCQNVLARLKEDNPRYDKLTTADTSTENTVS
ncbi:MAG: DUF6285 domain-containing protein [Pseudomonadota bacterium]|nr:DUF6285 domain-containing protein [Pseudomonadota bacterium]